MSPGTVSGLVLFSLHINDIILDIKFEIRLSAEDYICYREIRKNGGYIETSERYRWLRQLG